MKRLLATLSLCALSAYAAGALAVGTRTFDLASQKDFEGGDLEGVAIDSSGKVRAGFNLGEIPISEGTMIWSALAQPDGSVLLGTGNEGKLVEVRGTKVTVAAETKELAVTSVVQAWGKTVALATLPSGKIFKLEGGKLSLLATLKDAPHVWALAYDDRAKVLYAATGPEGRLYRITQQGQASVFFDAAEKHLMSVAVGPDGSVYAGAGDKAKLYKLSGPNRASVLYDFGRTEVRAIGFDKSGRVYAIANEISAGSYAQSFGGGLSPEGPAPTPPKTSGKGTLYRFDKDGTPEQLLDDKSEHFTSLAFGDDDRPYVGTGVEGKLYTIDENHNAVMVADTAERVIGALVMSGKDRYVAGSDPAVLRPVRGVGGTEAVWTSKVLDAELRARWGRISWEADGTLELSTRSGNTQEPDDSWSPWSAGLTAPGDVASPPGRYFQVRARWSRDKDAVLREVTIPFVTDNLRAMVTDITAEKKTKSSTGIEASGGPVTEKPNTKVKLDWKIDNPDKDELDYDLQYRLVGTTTWYPLGKPGEQVKGTSHQWETEHLPEGRYRVRVTASDSPSNPPDRVKSHFLESPVVIVDNTPPSVTNLRVQGRRVLGIAVDGVGPIQRIEISVAGNDEWIPFYPVDGVFDEQSEDFDADVTSLSGKGPALLSIRVFDSANNFVVQNVALQ